MSLVRFIEAMVGALLPQQYRRRWAWTWEANLRAGGICSGLAEAVISVGLIFYRYFAFMEWRMGTIYDAALSRPGGRDMAGDAAVYGAGFTTMVEYAFRPLTLLLLYFTIEGVVRLLAAAVVDECVGTMPLYLLASGLDRLNQAWKERQLPPRVLDEVQICKGISYDLCIASCRPKPSWDRLLTIEYNDELYELFDEKTGTAARPYLYQLRKLTPGRIVRGLHHYHPDEALTKKRGRQLAQESAAQKAE